MTTVLWKRLDREGHEAFRLVRGDEEWILEGEAVFAENRLPCSLDYRVVCDESWRTLAASIYGQVGLALVEVEVEVDASERWWLNGHEVPEVRGCIDVDLGFSPSTNTLPIRRLGLDVGASSPVSAAWLRFPQLDLTRLEQVYTRLSPAVYRYESAGGRFMRELEVDEHGIVTLYPDFWQAVS
jgi:hypothetical protein